MLRTVSDMNQYCQDELADMHCRSSDVQRGATEGC